jgi:hypothetical protein
MRTSLWIMVASFLIGLTQAAQGSPITLQNASFEDTGELYANNGSFAAATKWNPSANIDSIAVYPAAAYNNSNQLYDDPIPGGISVGGIYFQGGSLWQQTGHAFATNEIYDLSSYIGRRKDGGFPASSLNLLAGTSLNTATLLKSLSLTDPGLGKWTQQSLSFGPSSPNYAAVAGALGQNLIVSFTVAPIAAGETDFDLVQLSFTEAPEPASLALLALGGVGLLRRRSSPAAA